LDLKVEDLDSVVKDSDLEAEDLDLNMGRQYLGEWVVPICGYIHIT